MKIDYWRSAHGNFGDDLNEWLWREMLPGIWDDGDGIRFIGIGTVLDRGLETDQFTVIFGSGAGYAAPPRTLKDARKCKVYGVRGPLSAGAVGIAPDLALTDPAILLAALPRFQNLPRRGVIFVPHWKSVGIGTWPAICREAGIDYVDPRQDSELVIRRIGSASLVLAESMHAAIVADALRVPWISVTTTPEFLAFKWADWAASLGMTISTCLLRPSSLQEALRNRLLHLSQHRGIYATPEGGWIDFSDMEELRRGSAETFQRHGQQWRSTYTRYSDAFIKRVLKRTPQISGSMRTQALEQMRKLSGMPGQLSEESRHRERLEETLVRLRLLQEDYRQGRLSAQAHAG
jgi:succinoglycan biosynthesis protein ExoV